MQSVKILRDLWRRRIFVALVIVLAVVVGMLLAYHPSWPLERRGYTVGVATASVLLDTPQSQVVEVEPEGSDSLNSRANVLANLMADGEMKGRIVKRAGLSLKQVVATSESLGDAFAPAELTKDSYSYSTSVAVTSDMSTLPIIKVATQAPDVAGAIKLANAAVEGLTEYLDAKAADERVPDERRLRVRPLGTAQGHESTRGPGRIMAAAAAIFVLISGCTLILVLSALVRGWRIAVESERGLDQLAGKAQPGRESPEDAAPGFANEPAGQEVVEKLRAV